MPRIIASVFLTVFYLSAFALAGCVSTSEMFRGDQVSAGQVVALKDSGPYKGSLQNFDISIDYEFKHNSGILDISGQIALADRIPLLYGQLSYLETYLFFVDDANRVLKTVYLANAGTWDTTERRVFDKSLDIPAAAVGIAIGYRGSAKGDGDRDASSYYFDLLPQKK